MVKKARWLRIDERSDVLSSLSLCLDCLNAVSTDLANWKWAILSLHNALQGAMVCHLSGSAQLGALSEKCVTEWLDWRARDRLGKIKRIPAGVDEFGIPGFRFATAKDRPPRERLASPKELFDRLENIDKRCEAGAGALVKISDEQRISFERLQNLRNNFAHFTPKGWAIELSGLPTIFSDMIDIIGVVQDDPWSFRHLTTRQRRLSRKLIRGLRDAVREVESDRKSSRAVRSARDKK